MACFSHTNSLLCLMTMHLDSQKNNSVSMSANLKPGCEAGPGRLNQSKLEREARHMIG
jgi:hypothetical protein